MLNVFKGRKGFLKYKALTISTKTDQLHKKELLFIKRHQKPVKRQAAVYKRVATHVTDK